MKIEKALVGSLVMYPSKFISVCGTVKAEDFADDQARKVFEVSKGLWQQKKKVDAVTVFAEDNTLASFLSEAVDMATGAGIKDYANRVASCAKSRRIDTGLETILKQPAPSLEKLESMMSLYNKENDIAKKDAGIKAVMQRFNNVLITGISTGFPFLDDIYIKYVPGHIWTMGAFTSVGKTAVMIQKMCNLILNDENPAVIVISAEMTEEQLIARLLANFTGVHSQRILTKNYRQGEEEVVEEYKGLIASKNFTIHDDVYDLADIENVFRRKEMQGGVDVGFIDYVQNCSVKTAVSSYQEGAQLAKGLQKLAKDVRATIVCLSQVSNDVGRGNTDQLELKGAGEWAAVSDLGIMLQRGKNNKYALQYAVKKNRHGSLHEQKMEFKNDYTKLEAMGEIVAN